MGATVSLRDVTKEFHTSSGYVRAVDHLSLDINSGEIFGIIGYSGAGKSTLVRLINGLETPTAGTVSIDGQVITGLPERKLRPIRAGIGFIFQQFNLFSSRTVAGNVAYPLKVAGADKRERESRVAELLEFVGLADKAGQYPDQLSGGQKQRVGIARALATRPSLLLADEATSALDPETTQDVLDLLRRVNDKFGVTIAVITHEMAVVSYLCSRVAVMESGHVVETGNVYDVFANPQQMVTRRFVGTALHDRPSADVLKRLRSRHPGRIVTIGVNDQGGSATLLTERLRVHGVDGAIIHGGISEIETRPLGSLTVELTGGAAAIDAVIDDLRRQTTLTDHGTAANPVGVDAKDGDLR
ncbi:methionine ABC transporter ATP-binding protein [Propionimicrobium sp. PCR01-08-3]|uniref:methionine ABC transporter ATP-binding protein n=1 Tax=Propionimicrobium sp. PCR01-08-3 TaxID=3052086 RepID=UPI00255CC4AD|nr:methionine ABC transporter ATP-binding protein [Propionimicrobium sp. PCR01-08-3]WIY82464.1 methionine ABC transporter ATP-binding protein [Propionimicrobium sp. PCR01-08-3]